LWEKQILNLVGYTIGVLSLLLDAFSFYAVVMITLAFKPLVGGKCTDVSIKFAGSNIIPDSHSNGPCSCEFEAFPFKYPKNFQDFFQFM
jgi:hypothetical protein